MAKLYRVYKHYDGDYNFCYIEIITSEGYWEPRRIFHIKWQQCVNEKQYCGFHYHFSGRNELRLFTKISKQIEKSKQVNFNIQPWTMIQILEKLGYRQCEYYDCIGFTECKKVENPNNLIYSVYTDSKLWSTKLANKRRYKKQLSDGLEKIEFVISDHNDKIKRQKKFDINSLYEEYILADYGTEEEKQHYYRKQKLERIFKR